MVDKTGWTKKELKYGKTRKSTKKEKSSYKKRQRQRDKKKKAEKEAAALSKIRASAAQEKESARVIAEVAAKNVALKKKQAADQAAAAAAAKKKQAADQAAAAAAAKKKQPEEAAAAAPTPVTPITAAPAEKPGGWSNVIDVLSIAFNPFSKEKIAATTDNRVFNTAAEYVANSPYAAAAILTGAVGLAKGVTGLVAGTARGTIGKAAGVKLVETAQGYSAVSYAANTKTAAQTATMLGGVMAQLKKPAWTMAAVGAMIGTYPWAEWAHTEAGEVLGFTVSSALKSGDSTAIAEALAAQEEIMDPSLWEQIGRLIPGANIVVGFKKKTDAILAQMSVNKKLMEDTIKQIESGIAEEDVFVKAREEKEAASIREGERIQQAQQEQREAEERAAIREEQRWAQAREEQAAQDKAAVDHYNAERKKLLAWEEEAADRDMKEDAAFWAKEAAKQREMEAADRKAIADFWTAYRKQAYQYQQDNRPSNLNFGLL